MGWLDGIRKKKPLTDDEKQAQQIKAFNMFKDEKEAIEVADHLKITLDEAEHLYLDYQAYLERQKDLENKKKTTKKQKTSTPPYYVYKYIINLKTGRKDKKVTDVMAYDEVPDTEIDITDFAAQNGNGDYIVVDSKNIKAGVIKVMGQGFDDPFDELDDDDQAEYEEAWDEKKRGRGRRPQAPPYDPMGGWGNPGAVDENGNPMPMSPAMVAQRRGREMAQEKLESRMLVRQLMAQGMMTEAVQIHMQSKGVTPQQAKDSPTTMKAMIKEMSDLAKDLDAIRGGGPNKGPSAKTEKIQEIEAYKDVTKEIIVGIRENIIKPVGDYFSGESGGTDLELEKEIAGQEGGRMVGTIDYSDMALPPQQAVQEGPIDTPDDGGEDELDMSPDEDGDMTEEDLEDDGEELIEPPVAPPHPSKPQRRQRVVKPQEEDHEPEPQGEAEEEPDTDDSDAPSDD